MRRLWFSIGAKGSRGSLRTLFYCLLLLLPPLYGVTKGAVPTGDSSEHTADMGALPPPLLESHPQLTTFGNPERRPVGTLPVAVCLGAVKQVWHAALPLLALAIRAPTELAMFQQWQLEGG